MRTLNNNFYSFVVQWFWCFSHITSNYHQIKSCPQTTPPSSLGLSHHFCAKAHQMFGMLTLYIIIVIRPLYCHHSLAPVHLCLKHAHACPVWSSHTTKFITCGLRLVMLGWDTSHNDLIDYMDVPLLERRRTKFSKIVTCTFFQL